MANPVVSATRGRVRSAGTRQERIVRATAAQINAMFTNGSEIELVPTPGAGKVVIIEHLFIRKNHVTTTFTGGGTLTVEYDTGDVAIQATISAAVITTTADQQAAVAIAAAVDAVANSAIHLTNATGVFAAGGTSTVNIRVIYRIESAAAF